MRLHVCFVCSGNICRSPTAALVLRHALEEAGLGHTVQVSSAGTGGWHVGDPADARARRVLAERGYPTEHTAAQVDDEHLSADLLLAMDAGHHRRLAALLTARGDDGSRLRMFRSFDPSAGDDPDVPDPYYGDLRDYRLVLDLVERATPGLLEWVRLNIS